MPAWDSLISFLNIIVFFKFLYVRNLLVFMFSCIYMYIIFTFYNYVLYIYSTVNMRSIYMSINVIFMASLKNISLCSELYIHTSVDLECI